MKPCPYCKKDISDETTFCWYCGRELVARPERPEVVNKSTINWKVIAILAAVILVILVLTTIIK